MSTRLSARKRRTSSSLALSRVLAPLFLAICITSTTVRGAVQCRPTSWRSMLASLCMCEPCATCHFEISTWQCKRSGNETTASDNAPAPLMQPLLAPEDWFLNHDELIESRGGVPRTDLHLWSDGNLVTIFSTTDRFFASVFSDVEALGEHGQLMLTAWAVDDIPLVPKGSAWQESRLKTVFGRAMDRGVTISALVWTNLLDSSRQVSLQHWMNSYTSGMWLFDNRLPYRSSSHHQKTIVMLPAAGDTATGAVAYVGGIDLTNDRWDSHFHNQSHLREKRGIKSSYDGWIDASLQIRGPAVHDVAANFVARWNDKQPLLQDDPVFFQFSNPAIPRPKLSIPSTAMQQKKYQTVANASVQITRTYSCKVGYDFAPRGEVSILQARLKAIRNARNFIYIEDQYFVLVPQLLEALLERLPVIEALLIVAQKPTLDTTVAGYEKLLYEMLQPLQKQFPDKVFAMAPLTGLDLYVHSKVVLVDDVFLSIGSSNWNRRSMTSDSEVTANVVDRDTIVSTADGGITVSSLARRFRIEKFSEFSGLTVQEIGQMSFMDALAALLASASSSPVNGIVSALIVNNDIYYNAYPDGFEDQVDAEDTC